jgi:pimeloyl-ACP methyl ester carboxylesterase
MAKDAADDRPTVAVERYGPDGRSPWMDIDWTAHQRWVSVQGRWMNVIDLGPAEPRATIVWVHGLSGAWQNWLENLPFFARTHRVIAMDLPGFGASEMPAERISIAGYARAVDALLDTLGVSQAAVVGNSMGGFIAAELALRTDTWVQRLVLVSAAGLSFQQLHRQPLLGLLKLSQNVLTMGAGWLASRSDTLTARSRSRRAVLSIVAAHPDRLPAALAAEQLRGSGKPGFVDALDALTDYPIHDRLPNIAAPTLIVWGARDLLVPVRDAWRFGELIPDSRVVVYEDTGHVAMLERPEAFNALVAAFLDE